MQPRTAEEARRFGEAWAEAWNARDIDTVLAHYADSVTFHSPVAAQVAGTPMLRGKAALRAYWTMALRRISHLRFTVERVLFDAEQGEIAIFYLAELDERRTRACERLRFGGDGLAVLGDALYGAPVASDEQEISPGGTRGTGAPEDSTRALWCSGPSGSPGDMDQLSASSRMTSSAWAVRSLQGWPALRRMQLR